MDDGHKFPLLEPSQPNIFICATYGCHTEMSGRDSWTASTGQSGRQFYYELNRTRTRVLSLAGSCGPLPLVSGPPVACGDRLVTAERPLAFRWQSNGRRWQVTEELPGPLRPASAPDLCGLPAIPKSPPRLHCCSPAAARKSPIGRGRQQSLALCSPSARPL